MHFRTELKETFDHLGSGGLSTEELNVDVLIVGAGFGGIFCLYEMRKLGLHAVIF